MAAKEYVGSYGKINGKPAGVMLKEMRLAALERSKDKTEDVETSVATTGKGTQTTPATGPEPFAAGRAEREYDAFMKALGDADVKAASDKAAADDAAKKAAEAAATKAALDAASKAASTTTADTAETQAAENDPNSREVSSAAQVNKVRIPLRIVEEALKYPTKLGSKITDQAAAKAEKFVDAVGPIKKAPAGSILKTFDDAAAAAAASKAPVAGSLIPKIPAPSGKVAALMEKVLEADKAEKLKPLLEAAAKKTESLAPFVNAAGKVGKVLSVPLKATKVLAPIMETIDTYRFFNDEKFRDDSMKDMEEFGERGRKAFGAEGTLTDKVKYGGEALKQGLSIAKPLLTLGAMSTQMRESQRNAEAAGKAADAFAKRDADRKAFIVQFMRDNPKATPKDRFKALAAAFPNT